MRLLRFSLRKTRLDRIESMENRRRIGVEEVAKKLREKRLMWFGRVDRREGGDLQTALRKT